MTRRVVITGIGVISPLGNRKEDLADALWSRRSGVRTLDRIPTEHLPPYGGEASDFTGDIDDFGELEKTQKRNIRKGLKVMCREIQMGVAAAQLALCDAGLKPGDYDPDRTGVVFGSDYIMTLPDEFIAGIRKCTESGKFNFDRWAEEGLPEVTPLWLLKYLPNMPASHIAIYNDLRGPNNSLTVREASANLALGEALCTIRRGSADILLAGATGSRIHPLRAVHTSIQEEVSRNGVSADAASRPFDLHRTGMVVGEGAAVLIVEELAAAQARGANILAEVVGHSSSSAISRDSVAQIDKALANAMRAVLRSADMQPADVGHIHAHGLSTRRSDAAEAAAIREVFGEGDASPPVVAAKSSFGNLGAGSGMVELIASLAALEKGVLFPTLNYETPDPDCPIRINTADDAPAGDAVLNMNVTPQGQASAVIVRKFAA